MADALGFCAAVGLAALATWVRSHTQATRSADGGGDELSSPDAATAIVRSVRPGRAGAGRPRRVYPIPPPPPLPPPQFDGVFGEAIRREFALDFARFRHLNHGSYGTAPHAVMAAARASMLRIESFPDDFMRRRATSEFITICDAVGAFVAAPPGSVVMVENATAAVNAVLRSLEPLRAEDVLVINDNTYNACALAVKWVASIFHCHVATITFPLPATSPADLTAAFTAQLTGIADTAARAGGRVRFVLLDHITSPTAIVMPIADMVSAVHAVGGQAMVDGAHAPGMLPLDMLAIGADW